jgi:glutamate-1-semialdehyde 2,1-aminomutase
VTLSHSPFPAPPGPVRSTAKSAALSERAERVIPGGVNSGKRVLDPPLNPKSGAGPYVEDVDNNVYLDLNCAWGATVLGHDVTRISERVHQLTKGNVALSIGVTELEVRLAERIVEHVPAADQVILSSSGTEATAHAIRLARGVTGRSKLIKFEGHYHGNHDAVLLATFTPPEQIGTRHHSSAGTLEATTDATLVCRYNDLHSVQAALDEHGPDVAAVVVEPIAHNSPSIRPAPDFLPGLRTLCDRHGIVLIFDEVVSGWRHALGAYHTRTRVKPDLITFSKALGNGYAVAALAGRRDLLEHFSTAPHGDVLYGGTFNGTGTPVAAALATIEFLETDEVHDHLFRLGDRMRTGLRAVAKDLDVPIIVPGWGSVFSGPLWMEGPLQTYDDIKRNDQAFSIAFLTALRRRGVLVVSDPIARHCVSFSHSEDDIDWAIDMSREALQETLAARGLPRPASAA